MKSNNTDFSLLLNAMETLVWYLIDAKTYGASNQAHADFLALKREDFENKSLYQLFSKEEADLCVQGNELVFQKKKPLRSEEWVKNSRGEARLLSIAKTPKLNKEGEIEYVICSAIDITETWRAKEELSQSESRLRAIIEDQTELICRFLPGGILTFVNEAYCKYFNHSREDLIGKSFMPLIPKEDQGISEIHVASLSKKNPVTNYEHRIILEGGEIRWQQWRDRAIFNDQGEIIEYQGVGRDITKEKEATEALKRAHDELEERVEERTKELLHLNRALKKEIEEHKKTAKMLAAEKELLAVTLSSIGDGVITTDLDWVILSINERGSAITGWSQDRAIGKALHEVLTIVKDYRNHYFSTTINEQGDHGEEKLLARRDGEKRLLFERKSPIKDREGAIIGHVVVFSDITEKKRSARQRALSQKLVSIGQLAAGIAHEINTPLHYIQENADFLERSFHELDTIMRESNIYREGEEGLQFLREEIPQAIEETKEGIMQMSKIIRAMKDFAHPGSIGKSQADINQAIRSTVNICRYEWKYVATVKLDLDPALPPLTCAINEINQAIVNLIINAAQAIKEKDEKGLITITTRRRNESIELSVADTGPGISKELQERIFDPFFTTKEVGEGTGQGLAITYDIIVNKHGGDIQVQSHPGQGATFTLLVPFTSQKEGLNEREDTYSR